MGTSWIWKNICSACARPNRYAARYARCGFHEQRITRDEAIIPPSVDHVVCPTHRIDHAHMCPADSSQNTCKNNRSVLQNHRVIPVRSCDIRPFPHRTEHQPRSCFCQEPPSQHRKYISDIRQNILLKKGRPNHRNLAQNRNGEGKRLSKADAKL